jgi:hypothetical protein
VPYAGVRDSHSVHTTSGRSLIIVFDNLARCFVAVHIIVKRSRRCHYFSTSFSCGSCRGGCQARGRFCEHEDVVEDGIKKASSKELRERAAEDMRTAIEIEGAYYTEQCGDDDEFRAAKAGRLGDGEGSGGDGLGSGPLDRS